MAVSRVERKTRLNGAPRVPHAECRRTATVAGHFGEWVQGRLGPAGPLVLVTVACRALSVRALREGDGPLRLRQDPDILTEGRAGQLLSCLGMPPGRFALAASMPPGGGAGASTAALVALARAAGGDCPELAAACLAVEGASDPLMLPQPDAVLWEPRAARIRGALAPLPRVEIVGGFLGPGEATDPGDRAFPDIADLVPGLQRAGTPAALARIASESARRCTALRGPADDPTERLARDLGALGYLRAHTGSARGLIFAPGTVPERAEAALRRAGFARVLRFASGGRG